MLGWKPRSLEDSLAATGQSLLALGLLKAPPKPPSEGTSGASEHAAKERAAELEASHVDAVRQSGRDVALHREFAAVRADLGLVKCLTGIIGSASPWTSRIGGRLGRGCEGAGVGEHAGVADHSQREPGPAGADVERHHRSLAETDKGEVRFAQSCPREFRVDERVQDGRRAGRASLAGAGSMPVIPHH